MSRRGVGDREFIDMIRGVGARRVERSELETVREEDEGGNEAETSQRPNDADVAQTSGRTAGVVGAEEIVPGMNLEDRLNLYLERMQEVKEECARVREENAQLRKELDATFWQRSRSPVRVEVQRPMPEARTGGQEKRRQAAGKERQHRESSLRFDQSVRFDEGKNLREGSRRESQRSADRALEDRLRKMESMMERLLGASSSLKRCVGSFIDSPFAHHIAEVEMPRKFTLPAMKLYDGVDDPYDHIMSY